MKLARHLTFTRAGLVTSFLVLFLAWSAGLNLFVRHYQNDLKDTATVIAGLNELEQTLAPLGESPPATIASVKPNGIVERWRQVQEDYIAVRRSLLQSNPSTALVTPHLWRTDSLLASLALSHVRISSRSLADTERAQLRAAIEQTTLHAVENLHEAVKLAGSRLNTVTDRMWSAWQVLSVLVWIACLLVTIQIILFIVHRHSRSRRRLAERELDESEERYRRLVEMAPEAIVVHYEGTIAYVNPAAVRMFGASSEENGIGKPIYGFIHPDYQEIIRKRVNQLYRDRIATGALEVKMVRLDGQIIDVETAGVPIQFNGRPAAQTVVRDITERKRAEQQLQESERKYRSLIENSLQGVFVVYADPLKLAFVNSETSRIFGYSEEQLLDFTPDQIRSLLVPEDRETVIQRLRDRAAGNEVIPHYETRVIREDGSVRWIELSAARIEYLGRPAVQAAIVDITDHKQAEQLRHANEDKYRSLFQSSRDAIFIADLEGQILDVNPSMQDLTAHSREELLKCRFADLHSPEARKESRKTFQKLKRGGTAKFETDLVRKDGDVFRAEISASVFRLGQAQVVQGIVRDITKRKREEKQLLASERRLRRQNAVLVELATSNLPGSGDLPAALQAMTQKAAETVGVDRASVWQYTEDKSAIRCLDLYERSAERHSAGGELPAGQFPAYFAALESERIIAADNAHTDSRTCEFSETYLSPLNISSMLDAPIRIGGRTTGVICLEHIGPARTWSIEERQFTGSMADLVALAVASDERHKAEVALREERDRAQTYLELAGVMFVALDKDGVVTLINKKACEILGYMEQEIVGRRWIDTFVPADQRESVAEVFRRVLAETGEDLAYVESPVVTCDGSIRTIAWHNTLLRDDHGTVCGTLSSGEDVTDRKLVDEQLQQLAAFPQNNPDVVLTLDDGAQICYTNPASEQVLQDLELNGDERQRFLPDDVRDIVSSCLESQTGLHDVEVTVADRTWSWSFHPVPGQGLVHCHARDVTERIQSEEELRKLSAAVTQSANMIVITDCDGCIEYVNPQFTRVTGYALTEAVGRPASILKSGRQDREFYRELWETILAGKTWTGMLQNQRRDGTVYWERKTITPIFGSENRIINFLSVGEDISIEISVQQKLQEADKMSAVGMLAAGVAHEFKNYLTGIIGNASFALGELELDSDGHLATETLTKVIDLAERANEVAASLLTYSKAKVDEFTRESLQKVITKSIGLVKREMENLNIEVVTYFEEVPEVLISASKIQQLLLNLLINAQHAIKEDGVITIALLADEGHVIVKVGDTGTGIAEKHLSRIFDPFFSTKGVWGKDELVGTGLGLAICHNIAREHGGDLTVESIVGAGTAFTLTLPLGQADRALAALPAAAGPLSPQRDLKTVLFTLDKSVVSYYFKQGCEAHAEIVVIDQMKNLPEGLGRLADLAICDARFTGKVELYKMVQECRRHGVPYVLVNCGMMEYQLADLYENSAANFKQLPTLSRILQTVSNSAAREPAAN